MLKLKDLDLKSTFDDVDLESGIKLIKSKDLKKEDKLPIYSDVMFHTMFNNTNRIKYVCKFLSYFFDDTSYEDLLEKIVLLKDEEDRSNIESKARRVDLLLQVGNVKVNLEVNNCPTKDIMERNLEYISKVYGEGSKSGEKKERHHYCIQFNLNNFTRKNNKESIEIYAFRNSRGEILSEKLIVVQIYLPELEKKLKEIYNGDVEKLTERERFILMLMATSKEESKRLKIKGDKVMEEYINEAIDASHNKSVMDKYDDEWYKGQYKKWGEMVGREKGKEEGIKQEKINTVKNMLKKKSDINFISEITGLSLEEINNIKTN